MIEGSNFNIRHVVKSDLATLVPLMNNMNLRGEYLPFDMVSPDVLEKRFADTSLSTPERETLLIVDKDDKILGTLNHFKSIPYFNALELGYTLFATEQRRRGIASEAVRLLADYLFQLKMINRLEIRMDTGNIASERVAIKCGFTKEGVARAANFVRGRHVDMAMYALLRSEWAQSHAPASGS
jgi:RimJ/RimL family protein N-acetyltransferase